MNVAPFFFTHNKLMKDLNTVVYLVNNIISTHNIISSSKNNTYTLMHIYT